MNTKTLRVGESKILPPEEGYCLCFAEVRGGFILARWSRGGEKSELIDQFYNYEGKLIATYYADYR